MKLLLAVDIADRVRDALSGRHTLDFDTEARALLARHPEAHVTVDDIIVTMRHEMRAPRSQATPPESQ